MKKEKLVVWADPTMILWAATEAERRQISMSSLVRDALAEASLGWAPLPISLDSLLVGQSEVFADAKLPQNGAN